ncbi:DUF805 domain-containing protein [Modestobacter roseus]|uniref:Uncharacterized membrane protein YhaH (DUF805 family) n=1 Tax=Modestobacter roseus TaxID=1181884 RepID=A0A562IU13_9ACTN|nr:DUF805 domain-containing protein [Modestobacter roseus]TWH74253.1 uncharacterized membrane protein YhaH (DUF805 family) [Modestobacter roseus]
MSIAQWYVSRGRISRRTFWLHYVLPILLVNALAVAADLALGFSQVTDTTTTTTSFSVQATFGVLSPIVALLTLVPSFSSNVTRLHDRGHSAWWLLMGLIPLVGGLILLVQLGFLPGEERTNGYGPPPAGERVPEPDYPQTYN